MTTVLQVPIQSVNEALLHNLREQYPTAIVQVKTEQVADAERMDQPAFWRIIGQLDWRQRDRMEVIRPAVEMLSRYPLEAIYTFHDLMAEKLYTLDAQRFAVHLGSNRYSDSEERHFSVDDFLYSRCGVVARGHDYYQTVLQNPARMPKEFTFQLLLSLPRRTYQLKTGLSDYRHFPEFCCETFSNPEGWPDVVTLQERLLANV